MPTKIRLQRHGKKRYAYFHVVIADSRAPRDGKFIEKLGIYNPNTNPATIDIDFDKSLSWLKTGAQPTDTVKALLSYKGVIYKNHLDKGVAKGAFSQEDADKKFETWMEEKEAKVNAKKDSLTAAGDAEAKKRMDAETTANNKRAEAIAAKTAELAGEVADAASEVADTVVEAGKDAVEASADAVETAAEAVAEKAAEVKEAVSGDSNEEKKEA
jgi:small subunit ribosomal protein S16